MMMLGVAMIVVVSILFTNETLGSVTFTILLIIGIVFAVGGLADLFFRNRRRGDGRSRRDRRLPPPPPRHYDPYDRDERERAQFPEYRKKQAILTVPERSFYDLLVRIVPSHIFMVFAQVPLVSVIDKVTHTSYRNELFRIIDFCIVDVQTNEPLLLIELNDASHKRSEVIERDRKVAAICHNAGMPIISFTLEESKDEQLVERMLRAVL